MLSRSNSAMAPRVAMTDPRENLGIDASKSVKRPSPPMHRTTALIQLTTVFELPAASTQFRQPFAIQWFAHEPVESSVVRAVIDIQFGRAVDGNEVWLGNNPLPSQKPSSALALERCNALQFRPSQPCPTAPASSRKVLA